MHTTQFIFQRDSYVQLLEQTSNWRNALFIHPVYTLTAAQGLTHEVAVFFLQIKI